MMSLFEAAWVIARRDFVATVYSRSFILFLLAPLILFGFIVFFSQVADDADARRSQPVVAVVADSATVDGAGRGARAGWSTATVGADASPILRTVAPAENVAVQARALLADEDGGYSAVLSGTLDRPVLTGPTEVDD